MANLKAVAISSIIIILIIFSLISSPEILSEGINSEVTYSSEEKIAAQTSALDLVINETTGYFYVIDKANDVKYESSPQNWEQDMVAIDVWRTGLNSNLILKYASKDGMIVNRIDSYSGSVQKSGMKITYIENGFRLEYTFDELGFKIPLEIQISENRLITRVVMKDVISDGPFILTNIISLPFFGCASFNDEGYMFVPSGSGGIINFNSDRIFAGDYYGRVFGTDTTVMPGAYTDTTNDVRLPVFGISRNNAGYFAIITKGESFGSVNASISGYNTEFNNIYASFEIVTSEAYSIRDSIGKIREYRVYDNLPMIKSDLEVEYRFLDKNKSTYSDMAIGYRNYLIDNKKMEPIEIQRKLLLDVYGSVIRKKSFLGIPIERPVTLTTYSRIMDIVDDIKTSENEKIAVSLNMATNSSVKNIVSEDINPMRILGGKDKFDELSAHLGDELFVASESMIFSKRMFNFSEYKKASRTIMGLDARLNQYNLETNQKDSNLSQFLLTPELASKNITAIFNKYNNKKYSYFLPSFGQYLYSDFGKNQIDRDEAQKIIESTFAQAKTADKKIMISKGNSYMLPNVQAVKDISLDSGNSLIINYSVPFIPIALSGLVDLYSKPVNLAANPSREILKSIEYGLGIQYSIIDSPTILLKGTELQWLYGADYAFWEEDIKQAHNEFQEAVNIIGNSRIIYHEYLSDGLSVSTYENDIEVVTNIQNENKIFKGHTVPANAYIILNN